MDSACSCPDGFVGLQNKCRECRNEYARDYQRNRYEERKVAALSFLGGVCVDCGSDDDLQFDHVDPMSKYTEVTVMLSKYSWKRILQELAKCVLRCPSCHSVKSVDNRDVYVVDHGGGLSGKKNCPCQPCKDKKAEYMRNYNTEVPRSSSITERTKRAPFRDVYAEIARQEKALEEANRVPEVTFCRCGKSKHQRSLLCRECSDISRRVDVKDYPALDELIEMVRASSFSAVGRKLGISDNAIRKHLRKNGVDPTAIKRHDEDLQTVNIVDSVSVS